MTPKKRKRLSMPSFVILSGRKFKLALAPEGGLRMDTLGQYIQMQGRIVISVGVGDDQAKSTVLHEMFHDFDAQSSCDLTEVQVNSLSALMFAALRDNPRLIAWMQEK